MAVRFPVSEGTIARVPSLFPSLSTLVSANEKPGVRTGEGDANHKRILISGVVEFSQQHLTSCDHYESAWRTVNTGSNPVGATSRISLAFYVPCFRNIRMFLEHGTGSRPHSVRILIAF